MCICPRGFQYLYWRIISLYLYSATVPEGEDEEPMECPSPHLLAGNTTIPLPRGEDTREQEGEDYNDQTLAYDTSGTEGTVEGVANLTTEGGHTMPFDTLLNNSSTDRCGEQTVPYDGTAVCSSDAETQEVKTKAMSSEQVDGDCKSEKDRNEDTNGKGKRRKVTVIDPTIAYEMETDEEEQPQDGDQNMKKAIEPTVAYDLAEEGRDETERNGVSGSGSVGRATDPTVVYLLEEEEEEEESLETAMEGRVCEGKELKSKQREAIDPTVPYIIEDTEEGEDKEEEGDKDRVDPTVPYVAEDTESTEQGETKEEASVVVGSVKEEEEKVEKPRRGRIKRKDTNSVRGGKRHGRGRGRQEKTSGKALQEESGTADEGWNKKKEEEGSETQDGGTEEKIEEAEKEKEQELKKVEELEKGWLFVMILHDMCTVANCTVTGKTVLENFRPETKIFREFWSQGPEFSRKNSPRDHISIVKWSYHKNFGPIKGNTFPWNNCPSTIIPWKIGLRLIFLYVYRPSISFFQ